MKERVWALRRETHNDGEGVIELGPFALHHHFDQGGMAQIWRGIHNAQQIPVAIKLLTGPKAQTPRFYEGFWREIQAAARLSHPNIVMVFDYGVLPKDIDVRSRGRLVPGSPYLVMEFADEGTLYSQMGGLDWPGLRGFLLDLLSALAHSHARGVLHRDLKPANVLVCSDEVQGPVLKLSDFGIAHALHRWDGALVGGSPRKTHTRISGTFQYMAPEQFRGVLREFGPWTDLYSLGIMTYEMICGRPPFVGDNAFRLARHHLTETLPDFEPLFPIPSGLEAWVRRLVQKDPMDRFESAPDAAFALRQVSGELLPSFMGTDALNSDALVDTVFSGETPSDTVGTMLHVEWFVEEEPIPERSKPMASRAAPPLAECWPDPHETPSDLVGAGLGLYGLRKVPLIGRLVYRDALWSALRAVGASGTPRVVLLRGDEGTGKSRLAEWLCESVLETGGAFVLRAFMDERTGSARALGRMLAEHFGCDGLGRSETIEHLGARLQGARRPEPYEIDALASLIIKERGARHGVRIDTPTERHVLVHRHLARLGGERPVLVWLDDAHWDLDALAFVEHVMTDAARLGAPVLFVVTCMERDIHRVAATNIDRICGLDGVEVLDVPPLDASESGELVEHLLSLAGDLSAEVKAKMGGNPLFAVQLIGDWVQRGVLMPTPMGFALSDPELQAVPETLQEIWGQRLQRALEGFPPQTGIALELAAALGREISERELGSAASIMGLTIPSALQERLQQSQLAVPHPGGWSFVHGMLRRNLEASAQDQGRWMALHEAVLLMLDRIYGDTDNPSIARRRGLHLLHAGRKRDAAKAMLVAARGYRDTSHFQIALDLIDDRDAILDEIAPTDRDPKRLEGLILRADIHRIRWEHGEAEALASTVLERAEALSLPRGQALAVQAHLARHRGELDRALVLAEEALAIFESIDAPYSIATTLLSLAIIQRVQGRAVASIPFYLRAQGIFESHGAEASSAQCLYGLGNVHRQLQNLGEARAFYERARDILRDFGNRHALADCINGLADIARYQGELEEALDGYREAWVLLTSVGSNNAAVARLNLGIGLTLSGHYDEARLLFTQLLEQTRQPAFVALSHVLMLPSLAFEGDMEAFGTHFQLGVEGLEAASIIDPDIASLSSLAGELLARIGEPAWARRAWALARAQWVELGDKQQIERLDARLERLEQG